ncbi:RidA family protein [Methylobacterium terricola]|uniref:RidA family protein n=2 Tax=Methylobacterium terricola TaxID=2583531 RepID=A0A5C4L7E7_9HYPH|nr:RidA family protein [Methylobacterium terricola]
MAENDITRQPIQNGKSRLAVHRFPGGGGLVWCVASAPDTTKDLAGQIHDVLAAIDALLVAGGTTRSRIVKAEVVVTDHDRKPDFDAIWREWIPAGCGPVRSFVESRMPDGDLVEVIATAVLPAEA